MRFNVILEAQNLLSNVYNLQWSNSRMYHNMTNLRLHLLSTIYCVNYQYLQHVHSSVVYSGHHFRVKHFTCSTLLNNANYSFFSPQESKFSSYWILRQIARLVILALYDTEIRNHILLQICKTYL